MSQGTLEPFDDSNETTSSSYMISQMINHSLNDEKLILFGNLSKLIDKWI
ncbi:12888_t:CDS:1, partial [Entrophospora sp. SA101]